MGCRDVRVATVVLLVAAPLVLPAAIGGSFADPEVTDAAGDVDVTGVGLNSDVERMLDLTRGWVVRDGEALDFHLTVNGSDSIGFADAGQSVNATWHFAFTANGSDWRILLDWTGTPQQSPTARLLRDGSAVNTSLAQATDTENITLTWETAGQMLPDGTTLDQVHALTRAANGNEIDCHGIQAADCAPDEGFGADFTVTDPLAGLSISADPTEVSVSPGGGANVAVTVDNTGSAMRNVTFSTNAPGSWSPSFVPPNASVPGSGSNTTTLSLSIPDQEPAGETTFNVSANVDEGTVSTQVTVNVSKEAAPPYQVSLSVSQGARTVEPGGTASYEVQVSNVGSLDDTYDLSVEGDNPAWASLSTEQVSVPARQVRTVFVNVSVPDDAGAGATTHRLVVASTNDDTVTAERSLETTVSAGDEDEGGGFGIAEFLQANAQVLLLAGIVLLILIVIVVAIVVKRRRDRRFFGADQDDDEIYEP